MSGEPTRPVCFTILFVPSLKGRETCQRSLLNCKTRRFHRMRLSIFWCCLRSALCSLFRFHSKGAQCRQAMTDIKTYRDIWKRWKSSKWIRRRLSPLHQTALRTLFSQKSRCESEIEKRLFWLNKKDSQAGRAAVKSTWISNSGLSNYFQFNSWWGPYSFVSSPVPMNRTRSIVIASLQRLWHENLSPVRSAYNLI